MTHFDVLNKEEWNILLNALPQIAILIAGADGEIDDKEKDWADKVTKIRSFSYNEDLKEYYTIVSEDFQKHLDEVIKECPNEVEARTAYLTEKLARLNNVLPKLDKELARILLDDFKSFARHVAKASGGILNIMSISAEEKALLGLDMIQPIDYDL